MDMVGPTVRITMVFYLSVTINRLFLKYVHNRQEKNILAYMLIVGIKNHDFSGYIIELIVPLKLSPQVKINSDWNSKDFRARLSCCLISLAIDLCLGDYELYWSFDTLDGLMLMEGGEQINFCALVSGQVEMDSFVW